MGSYIGMKFSSYEEFKKFLDAYSKSHYVQFSISESRTLKCQRVKRITTANEKLVYYSITIACIFGGRPYRPRKSLGATKRKRRTNTFRRGCPAFFQLMLSYDAKHLEIVKGNLEHNHEVSKEIYESLPPQRKLPPEAIEKVRKLMQLKLCPKVMLEELIRDTGKKITRKDLVNTLKKIELSSSANKSSFPESSGASEMDAEISSLEVTNEVEIEADGNDSENSDDSDDMMEAMKMYFDNEDTSQASVTKDLNALKIPVSIACNLPALKTNSYAKVTPVREHHLGPVVQNCFSLQTDHTTPDNMQEIPPVYVSQNPQKINLQKGIISPNSVQTQKQSSRVPVLCISEKSHSLKKPVSEQFEPEQENSQQTSVANATVCHVNASSTSTTENFLMNNKQDEYDIYGQYLASEMRLIEDTKQRNILKVKLQLLIFKAHQGLLTLDD